VTVLRSPAKRVYESSVIETLERWDKELRPLFVDGEPLSDISTPVPEQFENLKHFPSHRRMMYCAIYIEARSASGSSAEKFIRAGNLFMTDGGQLSASVYSKNGEVRIDSGRYVDIL
jgi:hypothetical protein